MKMMVAAQGISFSFPQLGGFDLYPNPFPISFFQTRKNRNRKICCRCSHSSLDWDWNRWTRHFSHIQQAEGFASLLQFQLEDAIENEDFREAARLKRAVAEATSDDTVAEIMSQLKNSIDDERYHDALRLCRYTGSGLVGWWVGYSKDSDDPFGRIIRLITASPGTPIFEIYVVKNADDTYHMQVVYLQRAKGNSMNNPPTIPAKSPFKSEVENESSVEMQEHEDKVEEHVDKVEKNDEKNINIEGATEEGIKSVINFLKDKIPGLKVKVMNINVEEEGAEDNDSIKQLMQEESNKTSSGENPKEEVNSLDEHDEVTLEADSHASAEETDLDMKLFVGGVVHNDDDTPVNYEFMRLPAEIQDMEKDSFVLHIPRRNLDYDTREHKVPNNIKVTALAQGVSDLVPSDVAKAFWVSDEVSSKVSKSVREIVKLAISQAQKRSRLFEYTSFSRITSSRGDLDPFDGLYIGAFGPFGTEVVQLKRKFGHWNGVDDENNPSDMEFFEYVEAVKLTGDLNVPAGQVAFRAKIGRGNRNSNRGKFPNELGVDASYKGQGRIAELGFRNPKWVDGELLLLNGKGFGPYVKGADMGFLYVVPEKSFIVLFNRLKLPE
ncbi:protein EXECUTER 2, chloroplastic-like isoform X2 [Gastrolobium bilobum]|uniref:protein EXECUTER 2, chloroplastic-like isoform X2 n=1 Tax=Gastrolobium bilobum TaxID=150636 RepID=UPI002AB313DF|nr:protein EXECUTER 2, chloroplastic-like isoform X2 [Gastrolobium bilobum]